MFTEKSSNIIMQAQPPAFTQSTPIGPGRIQLLGHDYIGHNNIGHKYIGECYAPFECSCQGGHFEHWRAYTRAIDMPSAMADVGRWPTAAFSQSTPIGPGGMVADNTG